ncbi:MAG: ABC transporter substrate-binding protein [Coprobacillus sp.]|nr:ABC transporter substrate-binding protein [Coprobacillus sp.]
MKVSKSKTIMALALCAVTLAGTSCSSGYKTFTIENALYGINGKTARDTYNAFLATSIDTLNYLDSQESADAEHYANFVDGLLVHDQYGILQKNLATEVRHNADYTKFAFTVKEGVPWVKWNGSNYTVGGKKQYVSAQDFLTSAKATLTYSNGSSLYYLIAQFVKGAEEYYWYTYVLDEIAQGGRTGSSLANDKDRQVEIIMNGIEENNPTVYNAWYKDNPITVDDLDDIASGARLGITVDGVTSNGGGTVTYELYTAASFFPTMFTYSCFLPTNETFLNDTGFASFGSAKDKILYCGPYLLKDYDETQVNYVKNNSYWNKDIVHLENIHYTVAPSTIDDDYTRNAFENGQVDGFTVSSRDVAGWQKYITGPDGSGSIEDPYDPTVYSRWLDTIGNMYGTNLVLGRDKENRDSTNCIYTTGIKKDDVDNTARALSLQPVRNAILKSLDYESYNQSYGAEEIYQTQYMVHTYVPRGFVIDDDGNDYVTHHLYQVYADHLGIYSGIDEYEADGTIVPGSVAELLEPGQYATRQQTPEQIKAFAEEAKTAIGLYNDISENKTITLPIKVSVYCSYFDSDSRVFTSETLESMNAWINGYSVREYRDLSDEDLEDPDKIWCTFLPTDKVTSSNYDEVTHNGYFDLSIAQWGWGADYGDPLSYMNTYRIGGDWADVFPYISDEETANYNLVYDASGSPKLEYTNLLEEYTAIVAQGAAVTDDTNQRFDIFAEAEYMLEQELAIYMPHCNYGQGWAVSVSRTIGYEMPAGAYGISDDRLTGIWVLDELLQSDERKQIKANFDEAKEAYIQELKDANNGKSSSLNIYDLNDYLIPD